MTRIFDALRKSQAARHPAAHAAAPTVLQPVRGAQPASRAVEHLDVATLGPAAPLDGEVLREMSSLRVHLEGLLPARSPRAVGFLSAQGGDGTSTVALQFAESLAREPDQRVLVVDANLQRGSRLLEKARAAAPQEGTRGAINLLPLGDLLRAGPPMPIVAFREILEAAGAGYDWMIVDGSPLLESPEAAPMAAQLDGVVLVVRSGRSRRPVLHRAIDLLKRSGANPLGSVLNRRRLEIPDFLYRRI